MFDLDSAGAPLTWKKSVLVFFVVGINFAQWIIEILSVVLLGLSAAEADYNSAAEGGGFPSWR